MHDVQTYGERNNWIVGWVACGVATLTSIALILLDWQRRSPVGKFAAVVFVAFLVMVPVTIMIRRKKGKQVMAGWTFTLGYVLLMLALQAFGPATHLR